MRAVWLPIAALVLGAHATCAQQATSATQRPPADAGKITAAEIHAVVEKLRPCWRPFKTSAVVTIKVSLSPDGRPIDAEIGDIGRYRADQNYRLIADSVLRAVMNPRCHPWPLAPEKYALWRTITFNFDSRDL